MRLRGFSIIVDQCAQPHTLKNCTVVIDAQNFMYDLYENSNLHYEFGPECDLYADYVRKHLNMFKEVNVKCYFIFKGGTKNLERKISEQKSAKLSNNPILMNDIHLQILDEMGFDYVFTEYEAKTECIALAKKLSCPVLSMDVEYAFSGAQYVPRITLVFNENDKQMHCKMVSLNDLLQRFSLDKYKLAMFILLSDEKIFYDNVFSDFFLKQRLPIDNSYKRHMLLLKWLSETPADSILKIILNCKNAPKKKIPEELEYVEKLIDREFNGPLALDYNLNRNYLTENWFEKGVALNFIAKQYIDIYRSKILLVKFGPLEDKDNLMPLWVKIVKYAHDLLTNFSSDGFHFIVNYMGNFSQRMHVKDSIKKPVCLADSSIFENGWDNISSLGLFEHFITEEINLDFDELLIVPDDVKLLLIALLYYSRKKTDDTTKLSCSVLLCYVMLNVVKNSDTAAHDEASVSSTDCKMAAELLHTYFKVRHNKIDVEANINLLHSMSDFQHCLKHINYLNNLCGLPFKPTIYGKTYNATFIYNILYRMQNTDDFSFFNKTLKSAPTVLNYVNNIINLYKSMV